MLAYLPAWNQNGTNKMVTSSMFIIAEAGVNHNGDVEIAKEMIHAAAGAGADAVKFQSFNTNQMASKHAPCAPYQKRAANYRDQLGMLMELELSRDDFEQLFTECKKSGISFIASPFDTDSADYLYKLGVELFKIASGEITNFPLLRQIGGYRKPVVLSTGMATLGEIEWAINTLIRFGLKREMITLMHCNTSYPTPIEDVNLRAMLTLKEAFQCPVGYSDHTLGIEIPIAAAALGARFIEKHLTINRSLQGPDHAASLEPHELKEMVRAIRNVEKALGSGIKSPSPSELVNLEAARKSIVAKRPIKKGEEFTEENITTKRPGTGLSPIYWEELVGKKAKRDFEFDELIEF